jgi:hypothetical protein
VGSGMFQLVPRAVVAQVVLVLLAQRLPVQPIA